MANEKRLIDANALIFHLGEEPMVWSDGEAEIQERNDWRRFKACIEAQPTVYAVERYEYDAIVEKLESLLCHATGGKFSKAGYSWEDMERMVTDHIEECCEEAIAEEVVHGQWVTGEKGKTYCGRCRVIDDYASVHNYCPFCGAKMDLED